MVVQAERGASWHRGKLNRVKALRNRAQKRERVALSRTTYVYVDAWLSNGKIITIEGRERERERERRKEDRDAKDGFSVSCQISTIFPKDLGNTAKGRSMYLYKFYDHACWTRPATMVTGKM